MGAAIQYALPLSAAFFQNNTVIIGLNQNKKGKISPSESGSKVQF